MLAKNPFILSFATVFLTTTVNAAELSPCEKLSSTHWSGTLTSNHATPSAAISDLFILTVLDNDKYDAIAIIHYNIDKPSTVGIGGTCTNNSDGSATINANSSDGYQITAVKMRPDDASIDIISSVLQPNDSDNIRIGTLTRF